MRTGFKIVWGLFFMVCCCSYGHAQRSADSVAIIRLLEKESATWRSGDMAAHASCWLIRPYSRILVSTADGKTFDVDPKTMLHPPPGMMGKGGKAVNSNYLMYIGQDNAWVSHNEESTGIDGTKTYSYEIRLLEKTGGSWKLTGQSIHLYKP